MKELFDTIDLALSNRLSANGEEAHVSRFYSGDNDIVVATKSHDPHSHESIVYVMRANGWALYDIGGNCEYYMISFKRNNNK